MRISHQSQTTHHSHRGDATADLEDGRRSRASSPEAEAQAAVRKESCLSSKVLLIGIAAALVCLASFGIYGLCCSGRSSGKQGTRPVPRTEPVSDPMVPNQLTILPEIVERVERPDGTIIYRLPTAHAVDPWLKLIDGPSKHTLSGKTVVKPPAEPTVPQSSCDFVIESFKSPDATTQGCKKLFEVMKDLPRQEVAIRLGWLLSECPAAGENGRSYQGAHELFNTLVCNTAFRDFLSWKGLRRRLRDARHGGPFWGTVVILPGWNASDPHFLADSDDVNLDFSGDVWSWQKAENAKCHGLNLESRTPILLGPTNRKEWPRMELDEAEYLEVGDWYLGTDSDEFFPSDSEESCQ